MLAGPDLRKRMLLAFHHYDVHLSSYLLMQIFSWLAGLCYYGDDMEEYRGLCNMIDRYATC